MVWRITAEGLKDGGGVVVARTEAEVLFIIEDLLKGIFGAPGDKIVIAKEGDG